MYKSLADALEADDEHADWDAERDVEVAGGAAGMNRRRGAGRAHRAEVARTRAEGETGGERMGEHERAAEAAAVLTVGRELEDLGKAAKLRGERVPPGAETPSGWRVLARLDLSTHVMHREDLWAVRAPRAEGGRIVLLSVKTSWGWGSFDARDWSWGEAVRLVEARRSALVEAEALLASARAPVPAARRAGPGGRLRGARGPAAPNDADDPGPGSGR